jgi:hypothetical protein
MSASGPTLQIGERGAKPRSPIDAAVEPMNPRSTFTPLSGSEYETAIALLLESGFDPGEFVLEEQRSEAQDGSTAAPVPKVVSVIRLPVGLHRRYPAGVAGTWPCEFERDLRCGTYGDPTFAATVKDVHAMRTPKEKGPR